MSAWRKALVLVAGVTVLVLATGVAQAGPPPKPNPQQFEVYDDTSGGLVVGVNPDIGNVQAVANPGGKERLIIEIHVQFAAPTCTLTVELVRSSAATNGGLDGAGHTGSIQILGTLTTNLVGNGNAHFDFAPSSDGVADTAAFGHIDLEDNNVAPCTESDGTGVAFNEYGAAPDPTLGTPFTWFE